MLYDAIMLIVDFMHDLLNALSVDIGGVNLLYVILILIVISMFATLWFKGAKG